MEPKKNTKIINSKDLLMISLSKFYSQRNNINKILSIKEPSDNEKKKKTKIKSLR